MTKFVNCTVLEFNFKIGTKVSYSWLMSLTALMSFVSIYHKALFCRGASMNALTLRKLLSVET